MCGYLITAGFYGPSFIFEIPSNQFTAELFIRAYLNSFRQYSIVAANSQNNSLQELLHFFEKNSEISVELDLDIFKGIESIFIDIEKNPHQNKNKHQHYKDLMKFIPNSNEYDYLMIAIRKDSTDQRIIPVINKWNVFHNILITWINILTPHFVWGDIMPTLKRDGGTDSRMNVWGYNYYSRQLVDMIGKERFQELAKSVHEWNLESVTDGFVLKGFPNPYSMRKTLKTKAKQILHLDEVLHGIINMKSINIQKNREKPSEKIIE